MLRLISILLLLAGLAAAGIGGAALLEEYRPHDAQMMTESAPAPMSGMTAGSSAPDAVTEASPDDSMDAAMDAAPFEAMEAPDPVVAAMPPPVASAPPMARRTQAPTASRTRSLTASSESDTMADVASAGDTSGTTDGFTEDALGEIAGIAGPVPAPVKSRSEAFLETLQTVPVAHETPTSAEYKRAFDVTLAIDATGDDTAADALPGRGNVVTGEAKVSDRVEARVSGANFEIIELSPSIQSLSPLTENVWRWSVMPLSAGEHDLVFEIYAIDQDSVVPLRTFRDTVTVQVSGLNRAIAFADQANPLFVLLGGLGSAIAGLLGAVKFFGRR